MIKFLLIKILVVYLYYKNKIVMSLIEYHGAIYNIHQIVKVGVIMSSAIVEDENQKFTLVVDFCDGTKLEIEKYDQNEMDKIRESIISEMMSLHTSNILKI